MLLALWTIVDSVTTRGGEKQTSVREVYFNVLYSHAKRHCVLSMAAMLLLRGRPAVRLRHSTGTSSRWTRSCRYWEAVLLLRAK